MLHIEKYLNNTTQNENGVFYKNTEAFDSRQGICHIGELSLEILADYKKMGADLSDEDIVALGIGDTYETILDSVKVYWDEIDDETKNESTPEQVAESVFSSVDWTCVDTEILELTY